MTAAFFRCVDDTDKAAILRAHHRGASQHARYDVASEKFREIPTSPFAYWISQDVRDLFAEMSPFESEDAKRYARQGLATSDDFRFIRGWFEVPPTSIDWRPMTKGGRRITFYRDIDALVRWSLDGHELKAYAETTPGTKHWSRNIRNPDLYFRQGLSWPLRGLAFSAQAVPSGCAFSIAGKMAFVPQGTELMYLAILNSMAFDRLMGLFAGKVGGVQYEAGLIRRTPVPHFRSTEGSCLADSARQGWSLRHWLDTVAEVSHAFVIPAVLQVDGEGLGLRTSEWSARVARLEDELQQVHAKIDDLCFALYAISGEDRLAIVEGFGVAGPVGDDGTNDGDQDADEEDDSALVELDPTGLATGLVSWAVGVGVGRFDVRLATGERAWPEEPDPFDALPVCSPGMLTGDDGLPLLGPPDGYPVLVSSVLVDDPGHPWDISGRVRAVFEVVFGHSCDAWWSDVGTALDARGGDIGSWLRKGFFDYHLKTHSRSRRRAPLLWPIGTKSGSYLVWLYAHRVSGDSLFKVLHDVVVPKLSVEDRELARLRQDGGASPSASQRNAIEVQERLVAELRALREELEWVAPLWAPDLNDGVVIVLAPLWRLFAHHRSWSNELKRHWVKLAKGDYDWAQLAMHLWPERVVPKCAEDRSLAIAHGLEDTFWVQDLTNKDKWYSRQEAASATEGIVAGHYNPAVTAALQRAST